jgi:hypothetical protein
VGEILIGFMDLPGCWDGAGLDFGGDKKVTRRWVTSALIQLSGDVDPVGIGAMVKFRVDWAPLVLESGVDASDLTTAA